jgi:enoyl-CoA hydratase
MADLVLIETVDRVRTVTLNRPEARNALSVALQRDAGAALADADADPDVDVVIFTGSDPAFCAGLDLRELGQDASNLVGGADDPAISPFAALWKMTKPVIGAINGPCVTGGFELALACDFLVASDRAAFADTHARVGVMPAGGMSVFLPQVVGVRKAKEMSLSGNYMGAHEAFARGLVNHVVAHDELLPAARKLAADIAGNDQAAVRNLKKLYDANAKVTVGQGIDQEQEYFRAWRIDPAEIERRRAGIVERGRDQQ